jgi:hypothetical protein
LIDITFGAMLPPLESHSDIIATLVAHPDAVNDTRSPFETGTGAEYE